MKRIKTIRNWYSYSISIFTLSVISGCNSGESEIISRIESDLSVIMESQNEISDKYINCLELFSSVSIAADKYQRVYCEIAKGNSEQLRELGLEKTSILVESGYVIKVDAKNQNRIFFQTSAEEGLMGVTRYGLIYSYVRVERDSVYSLNLDSIDTLKTLNNHNHIIKVGEHSD